MAWEGNPEEYGRLALEADLAVTKCYACREYGHRTSDCPAHPRCVHCHATGHRINECPILAIELGEQPRQPVRIVYMRVTNWRRMLVVLGVGFLLGSAAAGLWWWIR